MARVIAVASAKGGVGKTTTTANVGAMLAATGADVVVIDGDIGMANLGAALGIEAAPKTLHDVLSGRATPSEATFEGPGGVYVVPGDTALSAYAEADPSELRSVVNVHSQADYVLIDVGAGISHETSLPLSLADEVLLVSTPERDALQDTEKTRQLTNQLGGTVAGAVITRADPSTPVSELVTGTLATEVLATIPEDEAVRDSLAVGEPLSDYAPHSPAAEGYRDLVAALTGVEPERPPGPAPDTDSEADTDAAAVGGVTDESANDDAVTDESTTAETTGEAEPTAEEAMADDDTVSISESTTDESDATASGADGADESGGSGDESSSESGSTQRPPDDLESKWAEAATGGSADTDDESDETTESIAEATDVDSDTPVADESPSTTEPEPDIEPAAEEAVADDGVAIDDEDTSEAESEAASESGPEDEEMTPEPGQADAGVTPEDVATADDEAGDSVAEGGVTVPEATAGEDETGADTATSDAKPDAEAVTESAEETASVDDDAIPFRDDDGDAGDVVEPVEPTPDDHQPEDADDAEPVEPTPEETPVIPDAEGDEGGSAVPTELMGGPDDETDEDDEDDEEESKGFLRRLLFG